MAENYLSTGDFANLCKVNKQTIIYYDQIGLLTPVYRNDKGYRFYSLRQLELFNVIYLLKELGMSLQEIKNYMEEKSPELFYSLMTRQKEKVRQKQRLLEQLERRMEIKLELLEEAATVEVGHILFQQLPESYLYLSSTIKDVTDEEFAKLVTQFINELHQQDLDTGFQIGGLTKREQLIVKDYTNYSYLYIKQPQQQEPYLKIAAGMYAIAYHVGTEDTISDTYEQLLTEITQQNYDIGDYVMEEYIYDGVVKNNEEDYITKIVVQLK